MRSNRSTHLFVVAILCFGCSQKDDGPAAETSSLNPQLVCGEQIVTPITIQGQGLSPRVAGALAGDPRLDLPIISIRRAQTLQGSAVTDAQEIVIPDDRDAGAAAHVRWTSQQQMSFDVFPELHLEPGIYDVKVANPNGKASTLRAALMVVPRPTITSIVRSEICTAQFDEIMVVTSGSGFIVVDGQLPVVKAGSTVLETIGVDDCVALGQGSTLDAGTDADADVDSGAGPVAPDASLPVPPGTSVCSKLMFGVRRDQLPPGAYDIQITNPTPAACSTTDSVQLTVAPPPTVTSIAPTKSCAGGGTLTIGGTGFLPGATVLIGNLAASNVTVVSGTEIKASFGAGLDPGSYVVTVVNADRCRADSATQLQIVSGPIVFASSPPVVWNGMATEVTFWASGLSGAPTEVAIQQSGQPSTRIVLDSSYSPSKPHEVLATIPNGAAAGTYDIFLEDPAACVAILPNGLKVVEDKPLSISSIDPPFAQAGTTAGVTVTGDGTSGGGFAAVPLVYLSANGKATALAGVSFLSASRLTAVVPKLAAGTYDLIVVNPNGAVGVLAGAFTETTDPPPAITSITPGSVPAGGSEPFSILGSGFITGASGTTVKLTCNAPGSTTAAITVNATTLNTSSATRLNVTADMSTVAAGDACVIRATNPDGSYSDYSALGTTTPAENLSPFALGTDMTVGRRAPASVAGRATPSARFLYAIGGDTGAAAGAMDSVEFAPVDAYGNMGAWTVNATKLPVNLTLAGAVIVGRTIYVVGGNTGAGVSNKVLHAAILDPTDVPAFADLDLARLGSNGVTPVGNGLGQGTWIYRISAVMASDDTVNPGGETLPSDPITIVLPQFQGNLQVTISWTPMAGAASYRVYRTTVADQPLGSERLVKEIAAGGGNSFTDTGDPASGAAPLPLGSTGAWSDLQKNMTVAREGAGVALVPHPTDPSTFFIQAAGGRNASGTVLDSYETLPITVAGPVAQTAGTWTVDTTHVLSAPRWQLGMYVVTHDNASHVPAGTVYVYFGPGMGATTATGAIDVGTLTSTGQFSTIAVAKSFGGNGLAGYGAIAANNTLYTFGGGGGAVPAPSGSASSTLICGGGGAGAGCNAADAAPTIGGWNSQGNLNIIPPRYLMGTAVESAFFFLVGGQTTDAASKTTALTLW